MKLLTPAEQSFLQAVSDLSYCNPFLPERIRLECRALEQDDDPSAMVWSKQSDWEGDRPNVQRLNDRVEQLAAELRSRLLKGAAAKPGELVLYEDAVHYLLYHRYRVQFSELMQPSSHSPQRQGKVRFWRAFLKDWSFFLDTSQHTFSSVADPAHWFAGFFQVRRAFHQIFHHILGGSMPAARLRAAVWESVFTHDMRRYRRWLYARLGDFTTLIVGPSGTGKDLVAQAIGLSRYIPFDAATEQFQEDFTGSFHALNLSALSPTLIESELFGHRRGAFTGAIGDRVGWLEVCRPLGTVFLDEIGELEGAIQVKLLRVLQGRTFQRLGDTEERHFHGKIIAATNRNLAEEMHTGRFREDFYYRLCSDLIYTPSLREQLADRPDDLRNLILLIVHRIAGEEMEDVAHEVERWIIQRLGADYPWPGNIRELEQCVRNVIVRRQYHPPRRFDGRSADVRQVLSLAFEQGTLTAEELLGQYCTLVYAQTGSYEQAAQRLRLDRRTVKSKVDVQLLARLQAAHQVGE